MNNIEIPAASDIRHRVEEIAKELSTYGLGILMPHAHDANGDIVALPAGVVSYEQNMRVTFVPEDSVSDDAVPVGWRWHEGAMVVCARCCGLPPNKGIR